MLERKKEKREEESRDKRPARRRIRVGKSHLISLSAVNPIEANARQLSTAPTSSPRLFLVLTSVACLARPMRDVALPRPRNVNCAPFT